MELRYVATIYDVAKRCSVSIATVSRALNGHPDVSAKTRQKVLDVCRELSYQPSATARGLTLNRSWTIGVYFQDDLTHPLYQHILSEFKHEIERAGYDLLFYNIHDPQSDPDHLIARLRYRNVDGILIAGYSDDQIHKRLTKLDIPCVGLNVKLDSSNASYVVSDHYGGALSAINYLFKFGHRNIAFIGNLNFHSIHDRFLGYADGLKSINIPLQEDWVVNSPWTEDGGYKSCKSILEYKYRPTAIFCASDMQAIGAMYAVEDAGLRVGADISIVGFDDIMLARYVRPKLTTVRQDQTRLAEIAAEQLISLIEETGQPESLVIPTQLVIRDSVGPVN